MFQQSAAISEGDVPRRLQRPGGARPTPAGAEADPLAALGRAVHGAVVSAARRILGLARARRRRRRSIGELERLSDYQRADLGLARLGIACPANESRLGGPTGGGPAPGTDFIAAVVAAAEAETPDAARTRHVEPGVPRRQGIYQVRRRTRRQP